MQVNQFQFQAQASQVDPPVKWFQVIYRLFSFVTVNSSIFQYVSYVFSRRINGCFLDYCHPD